MSDKKQQFEREPLSILRSIIIKVLSLSALILVLNLPEYLNTNLGIISIQLLTASSFILSIHSLRSRQETDLKSFAWYASALLVVAAPLLLFFSSKGIVDDKETLYYLSISIVLLPFIGLTAYFKWKGVSSKFNIFWSNLPDVLIVLVLGYILSMTENEISEFSISSEYLNTVVSWLIVSYYFFGYILEVLMNYDFENRPRAATSKTSYLFGHREEIDKEIALFLCSFVAWILITADMGPKPSASYEFKEVDNGEVVIISDSYIDATPFLASINGKSTTKVKQYYFEKYKDPRNYFVLLSLWSLLLLLLSIAKYKLRFDERVIGTIEVDDALESSGRYHLNYTCQDAHHLRFVERNKSKTPEELNATDRARLSAAYYELGKASYHSTDKKEDARKYWNQAIKLKKGFCLKEGKTDVTSAKYEGIDLRAVNDLVVLVYRTKINKNDPKFLEKISKLLYLGLEADDPDLIYNLAILLSMKPDVLKEICKDISGFSGKDFSDNDTDDVIVYLLEYAGKLGHERAYTLASERLSGLYTKATDEDFILIAKKRSSENIQVEKFKKPVELFIGAIQIIFMSLAVFLTLEIFNHPQSTNVGKGLGAISMLTVGLGVVFKSSIQSMVAGLRIYLDDLARTGDRVESETLNVSGRIESFTLTNIRIRNFDNSIISLALTKYLESPLTNWRMLERSQGRRIRRSLFIDVRSIQRYKTENSKIFENILKLPSMKDFVECKKVSFYKTYNEVNDVEKKLYEQVKNPDHGYLKCEEGCENGYPDRRFITNLGLYRAYIWQYLHDHDYIDSTSRIVVSQLQITPEGLPLEVYAYTLATNEFTDYRAYQNLQSDIFEHIIVSAEFFNLKFFQYYENDNDHIKSKRLSRK